MTDVFRQQFSQFASNGVIDRNEYLQLRQSAQLTRQQNANSLDAQTAEQLMTFLDKQQDTVNINYTLRSPNQAVLFQFKFSPHYSESDTIAGNTTLEQLANVSQSDLLDSTNDDDNRCGAASTLNAFLLMGGQLNDAVRMLGLPNSQSQMTYENIHLAQEKLYDIANTNGEAGLTSGYTYQYGADNKIVNARSTNEIVKAADTLGLKIQPLMGETRDTLNQREKAVKEFWALRPTGVLQVGVYLDQTTGTMKPLSQDGIQQNHFVLITRHNGHYIMLNSGVLNNGDGSARRVLSQTEMQDFVYRSSGSVNGISRY